MSARAQQIQVTTPSAFVLTPIFQHPSQNPPSEAPSQSPFGLPGGQISARTFPVIAATHGPFTSYPTKHDEEDDEQLLHTYASFHEEPVAALCANKRHNTSWTLCIPVPVPKIKNPTFLALHYMIKYATTCDDGNSTIQTDTILTTETLPGGVVTRNRDLGIYYKGDSETRNTGFAPRIVDHEEALCLSTTLAIKSNGGGEQWSHYIDNQHITPNVRVIDDCRLYVVFHVNEYPTTQTIRSLSVKVSATWQKEEVEQKAIADTKRKAKEEDDIQAKVKAETKAREAEERNAREEERQARVEEHQARVEERQAREEEHHARQEEKRAREENSVIHAPAVADTNLRARIDRVIEELGLPKCHDDHKFHKTLEGYDCEGGTHKITFAQLGMN